MKTKQTEAKNILTAVHTAQKLYFLEFGTYTTDMRLLDLTFPDSDKNLYAYSLTHDDVGYNATATANLDDDDTLDTWVINQDNALKHTIDDYKD